MEEMGKLKIGEDVVGVISGLAATEVEGVAGMSGGIAGGIAQLLGKNSLARGVKVNLQDNHEVSVDIFVIVDFGVRIPVVAFNIQEKVKRDVEKFTGLVVKEANVHVQGVMVEKKKEEVGK
jgi:uncharacterized alkaline shock family protein YloU